MHSKQWSRSTWRTVLTTATVSLGVALASCGSTNGTSRCDAARCVDAGDAAATDGARGPQPTDLIAITIVPGDTVLRVNEAMPNPTATFTVVAEQRNHTTRMLSTGYRLLLDNSALGTLGATNGNFRAAGAGGTSLIRAATTDGTGLSATTTITVFVERQVYGPGTDATVRDRFNAAPVAPDAATTGATVDYPLRGAVMPRNVHPPHLMWTARHTVAADDIYRVRLVRPHMVLEGFLSASAPGFAYDWDIGAAFPPVADTDVGLPIELEVSVLSGGMLRRGEPSNFRTIDGVVAGAVYYWSPPRGRVVRVDVDTARRVDFLPSPPNGCIACHAVSRDGRRMAAVTDNGRPYTGYDLTQDLTASPPPSVFTYADANQTGTFNADGTRMVVGLYSGGPFTLLDSSNGTPIATESPGHGRDPEWSPDNNVVAYSDETTNDLWVTPVLPGDHFGTPQLLHSAAATPGGSFDWHPTFTPDSRWLVFQHGDGAFTRQAGALFMLPRGGGTALRLDRANGGASGNDNWRPVFSPFDSGGYFWVLFTSGRPYGNAAAGVQNAKLIWVAAVRNRPDGTLDPSEVAYYLDGQEPITNLSPYWAPPPCRDNGTGCSTGAECCSANCEPDSTGVNTCRSPTGNCRPRGASCSVTGDCCAGLVCTTAHICDAPPPG